MVLFLIYNIINLKTVFNVIKILNLSLKYLEKLNLWVGVTHLKAIYLLF